MAPIAVSRKRSGREESGVEVGIGREMNNEGGTLDRSQFKKSLLQYAGFLS